MKLAASYLLGHPNWHRPDPGLCPRCEEEITAIEMLAAFVQRTLTAYPPGFTPPEGNGTHASLSYPSP